MHDQIARELTNINSFSRKRSAVMRITKDDKEFTEIVLSELSNSKRPLTQHDVRRSLQRLNQRKLDTILLLLGYIKDQGWTDGSGMGSLDHEMNNAGSGFMHSLFLLRKELAQIGKLDEFLKTMRWYNDFGEIYQHNLE
jgi:hypothetical protein